MITNSLNIKRQQKGTSPKEQGFPCESMNNKNPQRERDLSYTRYRQRYLQIFFALIIMGALTKGFAQSGSNCSNAVSLGNLKDSIYNLRIEYPQTEKWFSFTSDSSYINLYFGSLPVSNQRIKIDRINLFSNCSTNLTGKNSNATPGIKTDKIEQSISPFATYYLKVERYYNLLGSNIDTANKDMKLGVIEGNRTYSGSCSTICANLLPNGGFECYESTSPFLPVFPFYTLYDWNYTIYPNNYPSYFNSNFPNGNPFKAPLSSYGGLTGNSSNQIFANPSDGFIGIETNQNNSDVVELLFSPSLTNSQNYYVSYDITAGTNYDTYNDRIDLDISSNVTYTQYSNIGYAPTIQSGVITNTWTTRSSAFTASSNQEKIFIGNLAKQSYTPTQIGSTAQYYFIDNVMLKPFLVELGNGPSVCSGIAIPNIVIPCDYIYYGATYTWSHLVAGNSVVIKTGTILQGTETAGNLVAYTPTNTETLTLTISLNGLTAIDTYNITVLPSATASITVSSNSTTPGVFCNNNGVISVIGSFVNTLVFETPLADTYQWSVDGNPITGATSQTFTPGLIMLGNHTVSVLSTVIGGCDAHATITFSVVENGCYLTCAPVLGTTSLSSTNYLSGAHPYPNSNSSGFSSLPNTGATYIVDGTLTLSSNTSNSFTNCFFWMSPGSRIVIEAASGSNSAAELTLVSSELDGCVQMWDRIENRGALKANAQTTFNHAEAAIEVFVNSSTDINSCNFRNNVVGIFSRQRQNNNALYNFNLFTLSNNVFEGNNVGFLPAYTAAHSQNVGTTASTPQAQPIFYLKPASGVMLKYVNAVIIGNNNGATSNANRFKNMWNGISLNNCNATIRNCSFEGMESNANHAQMSADAGATAVLTNNASVSANVGSHYLNINSNAISSIGSTLNLYALEGNSATNPTFKNCFRGLCNLSGSLNPTLLNTGFEEIFYRDLYTGIWIENTRNTDLVNVFGNNIEANAFGMMLRTNAAGCRIEIYENTITAIKKNVVATVSNGIVDREINVNSFNPSIVIVNANTPAIRTIIRNNIIDGFGMNTGIEIKNSPRAAIRDNDITNYAAMSGGTAQNVYRGITLENCFSDTISCNRILDVSGIAYGTQDTSNAAISSTVSPSTLITCNTTDKFRNGMLFRLNNAGTRLRGNAINDHRIGLFYRKTANGSIANVGTQTHAGNVWAGTYSDLGAWFEGSPGISALSFNEFRVDQSSNADFIPLTRTPSTGWFISQTAQNQFLCSDTLPNCMITRTEGERLDQRQNLDYLNNFSNDSSVYANENLWEAKNLLYKALKFYKDSLVNDSGFVEVLDSLEATKMAELEAIQYEIENLYSNGDEQLEQIRVLISQKNSVLNLWMSAINATNLPQANLYAFDLLSINNAIDSLRAVENLSAELKRVTLLARLDAYETDNTRDESLVAILDVMLNTKMHNGYINLANYEQKINQIAYMCPTAGGEAVYLARVLNDILHDNATYNEEIICLADLNTRTSLIKNKPSQSSNVIQYASIYPNPTTGNLFVTSIGATINNIEVQDLTGRIVLKPTIDNRSIVNFNIENLSHGVYFVKVILSNNTIENHKINLVD
jgi:hypothetical protein